MTFLTGYNTTSWKAGAGQTSSLTEKPPNRSEGNRLWAESGVSADLCAQLLCAMPHRPVSTSSQMLVQRIQQGSERLGEGPPKASASSEGLSPHNHYKLYLDLVTMVVQFKHPIPIFHTLFCC